MCRVIAAVLSVLPLVGCEQAELSSAAAVDADREAFMNRTVRLEGTHVPRSDKLFFVSNGRLDYLVLEDASGRLPVWYDVAGRRCPPRLGARLTVEGKVIAAGPERRYIFAAESIALHDEPPLADDQVRLCQLSLQEQQLHAELGPEGLRRYWRDSGKPDRVLVYD